MFICWKRSLLLFKDKDCVPLPLVAQKAPVALSFVTPRVPLVGAQGSVVLSAADKTIHDVTLKYDAAVATATVEKIDVKDEGMRRTWGGDLYRILLTSTGPTDSGKWTIELV